VVAGAIRKMTSRLEDPVVYELPVGGESVPINSFVGQTLRLAFTGEIHCIHCNRSIKKTFNQGYCFPCFRALARCDGCIVRPERCHFHEGTCREPEWGEANCMQPHSVYLANSSSLKVGITRDVNIPTRWIDQGAAQALPIRHVESRLDSGRVEVALRALVSDRTDWRAMLRGDPEPVDMCAARDELMAQHLADEGVELPGRPLEDAQPLEIHYPVLEYPTKVRSHDLVKNPILEGTLQGIKGQYLIFDSCVINVRKYAGYCLEVAP
jgi:hypothetical protein